MASCAVVLAVGARLSGQASLSTAVLSQTVACCAMLDSGLPVMATSGVPKRLSTGMMALISCDSPLFDITSTRSCAVTMPRSPWLASAGCTNMAGVPVEARVAAILRPTWPLLPMPITTTRPGMASASATAWANESPKRALSPSTAAASMSKVACARASARAAAWGDKAGLGAVIAAFYRPPARARPAVTIAAPRGDSWRGPVGAGVRA